MNIVFTIKYVFAKFQISHLPQLFKIANTAVTIHDLSTARHFRHKMMKEDISSQEVCCLRMLR